MRPLNIVPLVLAGALGGAVVMKVTERPRPVQIAAASKAPEVLPAPAPQLPTPIVMPMETEPAATPEPAQPKPVLTKPVLTKPVLTKPVLTKPLPLRRTAIVPPKRVEFQHPVERHSVPAPAAPTVVAQVQIPPPAAVPPLTPVQPKETPPGNMEPEEATPLPAPIPDPPENHTVTLNAGILIPVRLLDSLSLERNQVGDRFAATLDHELDVDRFAIAERGARVEGTVVIADRSARTLSIELTRVETSDRQVVTIQTERFDKRVEPDLTQDVAKLGAGTVIGAVLGGIAGGGKGAAIGAGIGAGAGAGGVMLSRKPVTLPSETRIVFRLRAPVTITERRE